MAEKEVIFRYLICKKGIDSQVMSLNTDSIRCLIIILHDINAS